MISLEYKECSLFIRVWVLLRLRPWRHLGVGALERRWQNFSYAYIGCRDICFMDMKIKQEIKDQLAIERTRLAEERTDLAYIRTGFSLLLGGIFFIGYFLPGTVFMYVGYITILASLVFVSYGFYHHRKSTVFLNEVLNVPRRGVFKAKWFGEQLIRAGGRKVKGRGKNKEKE
ncbi:DUF202 domain-containing protein [Candidatus Micrarchaeota archaeon]|nr:DUF202 domain-containing protein [Candidatus Micrarchaeota archaeon]MBD3418226.1 DUF202 domain-containing protein [Candidatus Micrarchaeota archaeon]